MEPHDIHSNCHTMAAYMSNNSNKIALIFDRSFRVQQQCNAFETLVPNFNTALWKLDMSSEGPFETLVGLWS